MEENIFIHSATDYGPEDKFTGHLSYLLNNHPEIGQAWLDRLRAGAEPDVFRSAAKHADGNRQDMPDFLIAGEREDVICEHKLNAALGDDQLHRYQAFCSKRNRKTRLAFVSGTGPHEISTALCCDDNYLAPRGEGRKYFGWEDLYPIVAAHGQFRLAREFRVYMEYLGLRPSDTTQWSDLFTNAERMKDFAPQWADTIAHFTSDGVKVTRYTKKAPAVLFKGIRPWLTHFYLKPTPRPITPTVAMRGPFISAWLYVDEQSTAMTALAGDETSIANAPFPIISRPIRSQNTDASLGTWHREYIAALDDVASGDEKLMRQRLLAFASAVVADADEAVRRHTVATA